MKVYEIQQFGLESLVQAERPEPKIKDNQILIKVSAVSLNFRDLMTVMGSYNPKQKLPLIPLSDGVGEVVAIGQEVKRVKVGDRVAAIFAQKWIAGEPERKRLGTTLGGPYDGTLAEYIALDEDGIVHLPNHLSNEEAATLPCAGVTAWNAIISHGKLKAGDTILLQGTGGVSIFALQFAKLVGARVIITSSSDEKLARARALGADETINYKNNPDWEKQVRELTDGNGVDHVVEVGGTNTFDKALKSVRFAGQISVIGILSGPSAKLNLVPILMQNLRIQGIIVGSRTDFEDMNRAIELHKMKPVVDKLFSFDQTREAFEMMASGSHFGKIVIKF
ncbi:MAG: NAD(P)-dependent alcohol dehydrogenase [Acidobacteria bacterium]|nr:NAD(P)-dependent alcohol dehydrogenase [Acidobacteriota bacterium]